MEKNKKIIIGLLVIITLIVGFLIINGLKDKKDNSIGYSDIGGTDNVIKDSSGNKVNKSPKINSLKAYDDYKIENGQIKYSNGKTTFTCRITNLSTKTKNGQLVDIVFYDKDGKEVSKMGTYIRELKTNEIMDIQASINKDLANAYDYKFVKRTS